MKSLPNQLVQAITKELSAISKANLKKASTNLSERYSKGVFINSQHHRLAYIATRLPATYAVLYQVLQRIHPRLSDIQSFMDLGSGVGSSLWAASEILPNLTQSALYEKDTYLIQLGQRLTRNQVNLKEANWFHNDIAKVNSFSSHDLTLISYVLNELTPDDQAKLIKKAYSATDQLLILIEPGTPKGFGHILKARQDLIELGANIVAPCPHLHP